MEQLEQPDQDATTQGQEFTESSTYAAILRTGWISLAAAALVLLPIRLLQIAGCLE
jgi:hypothetical protein